jgi:hypothetical protein
MQGHLQRPIHLAVVADGVEGTMLRQFVSPQGVNKNFFHLQARANGQKCNVPVVFLYEQPVHFTPMFREVGWQVWVWKDESYLRAGVPGFGCFHLNSCCANFMIGRRVQHLPSRVSMTVIIRTSFEVKQEKTGNLGEYGRKDSKGQDFKRRCTWCESGKHLEPRG